MNVKSKLLLILMLVTPFFVHAGLSGNSWQQIKKKGEGTLTVRYYEVPAFIYENEEGQMEGICVEMLEDFRKHLKSKYGVELTYDFVETKESFGTFFEQVINGSPATIGIGNVAITSERKKQLLFTNPYFVNLSVVMTHDSVMKINNLEELAERYGDKKALVLQGTTYEKLIQKIKREHMPQLKVEYVASNDEILQRITSNPELFTLTDFVEFYRAVKKGEAVSCHLSSSAFPKNPMGFIMPFKSDWKAPFDQYLSQEYLESTQYRQLINKYLGRAFL